MAIFYIACFYAVASWYWFHGLTFNSLQPVFFLNKPDITGQLFILAGLQHSIIESPIFRIVFEVVFYLLPALLAFSFIKRYAILLPLGVFTIGYSLLYCYMFSCMSFVSIEPLISWFFIPLLFTGRRLAGFYFKLNILRILFILFFSSATLWKMRTGGLFNADQMSGILLSQHAVLLASAQNSFFRSLISFLIDHPQIANIIYWIVAAGELAFLVGLFTKKFDRILIFILISFLVFDYLLMQINYFSWLPFALCFHYSKREIPTMHYKISQD